MTATPSALFFAGALLAPGSAAKELANDPLPKRNLPLAVKSGVKIAFGTDLGEGVVYRKDGPPTAAGAE